MNTHMLFRKSNCAERREAQNFLGYFVWKITILHQKIFFFPIAEGGAKIFGVFRVRNHDFTPTNHIFSNFRGGRAPGAPPSGSAPAIDTLQHHSLSLTSSALDYSITSTLLYIYIYFFLCTYYFTLLYVYWLCFPTVFAKVCF
jgi:hypothetical protein